MSPYPLSVLHPTPHIASEGRKHLRSWDLGPPPRPDCQGAPDRMQGPNLALSSSGKTTSLCRGHREENEGWCLAAFMNDMRVVRTQRRRHPLLTLTNVPIPHTQIPPQECELRALCHEHVGQRPLMHAVWSQDRPKMRVRGGSGLSTNSRATYVPPKPGVCVCMCADRSRFSPRRPPRPQLPRSSPFLNSSRSQRWPGRSEG